MIIFLMVLRHCSFTFSSFFQVLDSLPSLKLDSLPDVHVPRFSDVHVPRFSDVHVPRVPRPDLHKLTDQLTCLHLQLASLKSSMKPGYVRLCAYICHGFMIFSD
jgi:hypothetical protein